MVAQLTVLPILSSADTNDTNTTWLIIDQINACRDIFPRPYNVLHEINESLRHQSENVKPP